MNRWLNILLSLTLLCSACSNPKGDDPQPPGPVTVTPSDTDDQKPPMPDDDDPSDPGTVDPSGPGDEDPSGPGDEDPSKPGDEDPSKPGDEDPSGPGDDPSKPDDPVKPDKDTPMGVDAGIDRWSSDEKDHGGTAE